MSEHTRIGRDARLTRRGALALGAGVAAAGITAARVAAQARIPFGSAVMISEFREDRGLRAELARRCDLIVPMNELKWEALRPTPGQFVFDDADTLIGFAMANGKRTHGHALVWGDALPPWARALREPRATERALVEHIERVVSAYAGRVPSWDVVNEVIAHDPAPNQPMRDTVWFRALGPTLVETAFRAAARSDPKARLVINDYDFENPDARTAARRRHVLDLIRRLQDQNIPVHQVGFQAHLYGERPLDPRGVTAFCRELGRLGVGVRVTELDVIDWKLPADTRIRDARIAEITRVFLEAMIEGQRPESIVTWGLTDRSTWVNEVFKRTDAARSRALPLDESLNEKPMWREIARLTGRTPS
jgi:endo-1,4-beta-xylanase